MPSKSHPTETDDEPVPSQALSFLSLAACTVLGVWGFDQDDEDAQGGLILLFVPLYQTMGVFVVLAVAAILEMATRIISNRT